MVNIKDYIVLKKELIKKVFPKFLKKKGELVKYLCGGHSLGLQKKMRQWLFGLVSNI